MRVEESLEAAAFRELAKETGLKDIFLEQSSRTMRNALPRFVRLHKRSVMIRTV